MTLHGSLFNLGAAAGGAIGGLLLSLAGYGALAIGLPIFGLGRRYSPGGRGAGQLRARSSVPFDGGTGVRRMPGRDDGWIRRLWTSQGARHESRPRPPRPAFRG